MKAQLKDALKEAMKSKDSLRMGVIRSVLSEVQYEEMNKGISEAGSSEVTVVLQREIKKRKEEIEFAEKANRIEAKDNLIKEISILESFLPSQLSQEQVKEYFLSLKEKDPSMNRGVAMKMIKDAFSGQYDGKIASDIAKEVFG